jgi:hypothetical protein
MDRKLETYTFTPRYIANKGKLEPANKPPERVTSIMTHNEGGIFVVPLAWVQYAMLYYVNS